LSDDGQEYKHENSRKIVCPVRSQITWKIKSELSNIPKVNQEFNAFAQKMGIDNPLRRRINLVFDELINNIVSYGYPDQGEHTISILAEIDASRLKISIEDDGIPFNPFETPDPDISQDIEARQVGGLGIHLIRHLMDETHYMRERGNNIVTVFLNLEGN
jgi:anti-sigma regulatory factor (Ser/Thr protein kinase)